MCGISGYYQNKSIPGLGEQTLQQMADSLHHRGPDYCGIYCDEIVGLAHNRLSLIDLSSNGNQPFEDDENVLIYNGEIYNFLELKKELPDKEYKSSSDTAVLFHALKHWGVPETLRRIQGMFAFAWYTKNDKKLYLCRDRYGIKPLFYGRDSLGTLWFASEQKAILKVAEFQPDSVQMLFSTLGTIEKSNHSTAWKNLFIVPAGSFLVIDADKIKNIAYYSLTDNVSQTEYNRLNKSSAKDVVQEFDHLLRKSVKKMLISDAPMGAYVSGGIDSSLISAYASEFKNPFKLFTANILGKISEFGDAQNLAKSLNQPLFDYPFSKEMALRDWAKVCWHYESPIVTHFSAIPFSNVSALAHKHQIKAVLTGEGSDELFLGYPKLLTRRYNNLIQFPLNTINSIYKRIPKLSSYQNKNEGSLGLLNLFEIGVQGFNRQIIRENQLSAYSFLPEREAKDHYLSAQMIQEGIRSLLWRNDRMGMIYSIESRFPFLDEDVVHFGMNLPVKYKIGKSIKFHNYKHPFLIDKAIIRNVASKYLPNSLTYKTKSGFPTYGLRHIKVKPHFLYNSVTAGILGLKNAHVDYLFNSQSPYHLSLLASFEIWAKLFVEKRNIEDITDLVQKSFKVI
jgi:asparagine synthase (glutamine-hydrolysing)